jgi:hypothetical protein
MSVLPLTLSISLCLVFTFVVFFLREQARRSFRGAEREALVPVTGAMPRSTGERDLPDAPPAD